MELKLILLTFLLLFNRSLTWAAERDYCISDCNADRGECRRTADHKISGVSNNDSVGTKKIPKTSDFDVKTFLDDRQTRTQEKQKMKEDEYNVCELSYVQCLKKCRSESSK